MPTDLLPYLPLSLRYKNNSVEVSRLIDSGAAVSVLPYQIGLEIGAIWEQQPTLFQLGGSLANYKSKGLIVTAEISEFPPVTLAFAWTKAENVPVILGREHFLPSLMFVFSVLQKPFKLNRSYERNNFRT